MKLNEFIDHTALRADTQKKEIELLCAEAKEYGFASVCVNSYYVPFVHEQLAGSYVKTCCVVGFPLGAMSTEGKRGETATAVEQGAEEVDMVINIGALLDREFDVVENDIRAVVDAAHPRAIVKVILETCLLSDEQKREACFLAKKAGADYVKTSTGFSTGGATAADVAFMRKIVGEGMGVKASGGIRSREDALAMLEAGASRIGTSSGVKIVNEEDTEKQKP